MYKKHQKDIQACVETKLESIKEDQGVVAMETKSCLEDFKNNIINADRPWIKDHVPKKVQEQLNELHDRHQAEIKRLEGEIALQKQSQQENVQDSTLITSQTITKPSSLNVYDFAEDEINASGMKLLLAWVLVNTNMYLVCFFSLKPQLIIALLTSTYP